MQGKYDEWFCVPKTYYLIYCSHISVEGKKVMAASNDFMAAVIINERFVS